MVFTPDESLKRKMQDHGSVLRFMNSKAGLGNGLIAGGMVFLIFGVLLGGMLLLPGTLRLRSILTLAGICCAPGILLIAIGAVLRQRRIVNWKKGYRKRSGLSEEELQQAETEFMEPGTVLFAFDEGKSLGRLKLAGFITEHYVKIPGPWSVMYRLSDLVACFYAKGVKEELDAEHAFVIYGTDPDRSYMLRDTANDKVNTEIVDAIASRCPSVIAARRFLYDGKEYDALLKQDEVIALHKRLLNKA